MPLRYHGTVNGAFIIAALAASIILHAGALKVFPKFKLLDFPERYGHDRPKLPYPTGILAIISFLIFFIILESITKQSLGLIFAVVILGIYSFADDRTPLPSWMRLAVQVLIAFIIFATLQNLHDYKSTGRTSRLRRTD